MQQIWQSKNSLVVVASIFLTGCVSLEHERSLTSAEDGTIGFLAVGDTGYHYSYQKSELYENPFKTVEAVRTAEFEEWTKEDYKPAEEFATAPLYFHQGVGGYIDASGLYPVGTAMKNYCMRAKCQFGVMTGDNIYPDGATLGTDGKDDLTRFQDVFVDPYVGLGANQSEFKIYVALGNHDWKTSRAGAMAQVAYHENAKQTYMDGLFYRVTPPSSNGEVEIFVIDTEVMLAGQKVLESELNPDGSETVHNELEVPDPWTRPSNEAERNMIGSLENSLKSSTAKWKFVLGHHPLWSSGGSKFEQAKAMRRLILPTLCKYADAYFAGHEHSLEIHTDSCETNPDGQSAKPFVQILSGAGAKQRSIHSPFKAHQDKMNPQMHAQYVRGMIWGFAHITLAGDTATATMVTTPNDGSGAPVIDYRFKFEHRSN